MINLDFRLLNLPVTSCVTLPCLYNVKLTAGMGEEGARSGSLIVPSPISLWGSFLDPGNQASILSHDAERTFSRSFQCHRVINDHQCCRLLGACRLLQARALLVTKRSFGIAFISKNAVDTRHIMGLGYCSCYRSALTKNDLSFEVPGMPVKGNERSDGSSGV